MTPTTLKLIISCGGTGGHFYPGLSIAQKLKERGGEPILFLSGVNSARQAEVAAENGIEALKLPDMPSPSSLKKAVKFFGGLAKGAAVAGDGMRQFKPDALLGMGSFASLPPIYAAWRRKVPVFLHDGNAKIGKANRLLSRVAVKMFEAFPPENGESVKCPSEISGMPVRPAFEFQPEKGRAAAVLNQLYKWPLDTNLPTLLVTGGSQGARSLNLACATAVAKLRSAGAQLQVIHLCGEKLLRETEDKYNALRCKVLLLGSSDRMAELYSVADFVFCRAGGSTVAELESFGKYGVLCPYPYAAELHQDSNAKCMAATGAAEVIGNSELNEDSALRILARLAAEPAVYRRKGEGGKTNIHQAAADTIIDAITARCHPLPENQPAVGGRGEQKRT